ncbi:hypothetical protein [Leadbettera azotonutricia]|uniref:Uncharacterized protein n=1 Tax=Leadbettera azotonutricia (strain ATCC BAA-888 / DSM 13862 / ZAS-9) TaxID=545695 RepID=F5YDJ0_LEAAZ|nr:hypothetical protein [Leadbettera azotonutricia]AEF82346.1 conserved hypothetical protein [Leadbettera azotonutricia ZAS-9]
MNIFINGSPADITLETEKTVGDILLGLEAWLTGTGNRLSGLSIDGKEIGVKALDDFFSREISDIKNLDIRISTWPALAAQALNDLRGICAYWENAGFEDRKALVSDWEKSAACVFLAAEISDMAGFASRAFKGEGLAPSQLSILAEERIRELSDPGAEIENAANAVQGIASRLEDLPLDIQTGKDGRAAETMQLFTRLGEKLFRLLFALKSRGLSIEGFTVDGSPVKSFMDDFSAALKELTAAYENRDSVLVGDLAEYELAPRLIKFFEALKEGASLTVS